MARTKTRESPAAISVQQLNRMAASRSERELREFFVEDVDQSGPFAPAIRFDRTKVVITEVAARSETAVTWANRFSRFRRRNEYMERLSGGYDGVRIVSEGDSWFQYPIMLEDTIDHLMADYAIYSLDAAGDTLQNMDKQAEFVEAIRAERPDVFLFSGGGNDVLGGGNLQTHLHPFDANLSPEQHILPSFDVQLRQCLTLYRQILARALGARPGLRVLIHGYDRPIPRKDGRWLGKPMISRKITDSGMQRAIAGILIDRFNDAIAQLAGQFPGVTYVDQRGVVGRTPDAWHDELHPTDQTYAKVAEQFRDVLRTISPARLMPRGGPRRGLSAASTDSAPPPSSNGVHFVEVPAGGAAPAAIVHGTEPALALHLGLNFVDPNHYAGWDGELQACEADAEDMHDITSGLGYKTRKLTGNSATRDAVKDEIRSAARRLAPGGIFVLTYSGHGGQMPDFNGDEDDSIDETWCLWNGELIDDELAELWTEFPAGARIFFLSDSCHSGTAFKVAPDGTPIRTASADPDSRPRLMPPQIANRVYRKHKEFYRGIKVSDTEAALLAKTKCTILSISGCQDNQLSADGPFNGRFTAALLATWNSGRFSGTYRSLHQKIRARMPMDQSPELRTYGTPNDAFIRQRPFQVMP